MEVCRRCGTKATGHCGEHTYCGSTCHSVDVQFGSHTCANYCGVCANPGANAKSCQVCAHPICEICAESEHCFQCVKIDARRSHSMSPEKARQILHDGQVRGHKLSPAQRRMFGAWSKRK